MSKNIALGIVIGGAISASLGRSINDTKGKIAGLTKEAGRARMFQKAISDTIRLREEMNRVSKAGGNIDYLSRKLDSQTSRLVRAGIEARNLSREYERMGKVAQSFELRARGRERMGRAAELGGQAVGMAAKTVAATAGPAVAAAEYQAIIRDIAIKAGIANTIQESKLSYGITKATQAEDGKQFISRNELAQAVNEMVSGGMDVSKAVQFAPLAAKFSVGQNSPVGEVGGLIRALESNALITDAGGMLKALESIAYLGKAGSFETADMARKFPELLSAMAGLKIFGQDAVNQLGAILQVEMKAAGSADEAANNLKNWISKIGSNETAKQYDKQGIDYEAKMKQAIKQGYSPLEASLVLAKAYIEKADPEKAREMAKSVEMISKESDPAKIKRMTKGFEEMMKTGDLFNDMQVKAALAAYMQNAQLYKKLKTEAAQANGEIGRDLEARRATSKQIWAEAGHSLDNAAKSIGDALRPITDETGKAIASLGYGIANISSNAPGAAASILGVSAAIPVLMGVAAKAMLIKGGVEMARGAAAGMGAGAVAGSVEAAAGGAVAGAVASKTGRLARVGTAARAGGGALLAGGRVALAAPSLGAIGGTGAAGLASAGLMVAGAGAAGYGLGVLINKGIEAGLSRMTGGQTSLGSKIYDLTHRDRARNAGPSIPKATALPALPAPSNAKPEKPPVTHVKQDISFSPHLHITVKGDVKDPARLAAEIMPYVKNAFKDFQEQQRRAALHDEPHM